MKRTLFILLLLATCGGKEATQAQFTVAVDSAGLQTVETDLGYNVELVGLRAAVRDFEFTVQGDEHESFALAQLWNIFVTKAYAHPGHSAGGEVTGELRGNFIIDWFDHGASLGTAQVLTGNYEGANFTFRNANTGDDLTVDDPLLGHTFHMALQVTQGTQTWNVEATFNFDEETKLTGAPFHHTVGEDSADIVGFSLSTNDTFNGNTLFDGIDFDALDVDRDGQIMIQESQMAHNQIRRFLGSHNFYFFTVQ